MDSAKTLVPRRVNKDKAADPEYLLKLHVTCVKYDGTRPDNIYLYTDAFPHDSANTVTIMYEEILKVGAYLYFSQTCPSLHQYSAAHPSLTPDTSAVFENYAHHVPVSTGDKEERWPPIRPSVVPTRQYVSREQEQIRDCLLSMGSTHGLGE